MLNIRNVTPETYERVKYLYINGVPCSEIEEITGCHHETFRRWMREDGISRAVKLGSKPTEPPPPPKKGKYDHLICEPRCQGKMYSEYK